MKEVIHKRLQVTWLHFYELSRREKSRNTVVMSTGQEQGGCWQAWVGKWELKLTGFSFCGDENVCLVAINLRLFSRVLTKLAVRVSAYFSMYLQRLTSEAAFSAMQLKSFPVSFKTLETEASILAQWLRCLYPTS